MSEYVDITTEFKDLPSLVTALCETGGWTREQIEIHETLQPLVGYDKVRNDQGAHVIVRRQHVGSASNDIGFRREANGRYTLLMGDYDRGTGEYASLASTARYGAKWQGRLKQNYAYQTLKSQQARYGRTVTRETKANGKMIVTVKGY